MKRACLVLLASLASVVGAQAGADSALRYSNAHGGRAFIVWQNGSVIRESYVHGGSLVRGENIYSITKSLAAIGTFSAIGKGWLKLDAPASEFLTSWKKSPAKSAITLREMLDQTSGLASGYETLYGKSLRDKRVAAVALPSVNPPGQVFAYGPANYECLEALMDRCLNRSPDEWIKNAVLTPLGIKPIQWRRDRKEHVFFSAGMFLTARDLLAVGQLIRQKGQKWLMPVFPSLIYEELTQGSAANRMYGLGFWLNRGALTPNATERDVEEAISRPLSRTDWASSCLSRKAPADMIAMVGSNGQRVYISASARLVIVRLGTSGSFRDPDFLQAFYR